jgi:hypothetical protein
MERKRNETLSRFDCEDKQTNPTTSERGFIMDTKEVDRKLLTLPSRDSQATVVEMQLFYEMMPSMKKVEIVVSRSCVRAKLQ